MFSRRKKNPSFPSIHIQGAYIEQIYTYKYLHVGVTLSSTLSWSPHSNFKVRKLLGLLYQIRLIFIESSAIVWDPHLVKDVVCLNIVKSLL